MSEEEKFRKERAILSVNDEIGKNYFEFISFLSSVSSYGIKADYVSVINYAYAARMKKMPVDIALLNMNDTEKIIIQRIKRDLKVIREKNIRTCKVK